MANTIDTIYAIWLREIKRYVKSKSRVIGSGGQPIIWLAIFGVGLGASFKYIMPGVNYTTYMAPGILGMTLLFTSIFAGINVIWDKQFGFLKEILVAPVPRSGIVLGKIIGSGTIAVLNALIILVVVVVFGVVPLSSLSAASVVVVLFFMAMISAIFVSIGLVIASYINNIEGFQVIVNFLVMPLFFLSGALFPLTDAPVWMKAIGFVDPLQYGVDGIRGALVGVHAFPIYIDAVIIIVVAVALVAISDIAFRRMQAK
jgi:ABC-2 type transport system permease protein